ncbi:MAG TPA: Gfo/Idh/MocA family oxidoreductase [Phycisphaerae bacterium]|nr:Gfo/Idh/MocA family oxidoreductase [Phycisphaerae bacterium]
MPSGVSNQSFATETKQQSTGKKLRVALIGAGGISDLHLNTLKKFGDVEVVAATDDRRERLDWVREKHGITALFTSWKEMLKAVKPDAVDVCTPNGLHAPATIDALNAGAHVMTEKPMAMTPKECQKMIAAAAKNKKKLAVGFQYRFHPSTRFLKQARDEGEFGKVMFVKCQALRRRGIPNWGVFGQKHLQGGGPMIDIGVHVIEMAHYVMGSPKPIAASGNTWTYMGNKPSTIASPWPNWDYKTYTVEDLAIGQIRFDNGAILQIEASFVAHIEKDVWNFTLMGEKGGCTWDPAAVFTDHAGHMINYSPTYTGDGSFPALFDYKLRNWVDAILYNKPLEAPGEAGLAVQKILDGVYRSAEAGKEVKID